MNSQENKSATETSENMELEVNNNINMKQKIDQIKLEETNPSLNSIFYYLDRIQEFNGENKQFLVIGIAASALRGLMAGVQG